MYTRTVAVAMLATAASLTLVAAATPAHAQSTTVVISEVQTRDNGNVHANYAELHNLTDSAIDMSSWSVIFYDGNNTVTAIAQFSAGTTIPAHGFIIVKDPNYAPPCQPGAQLVNYTSLVGSADALPDDGGVALFDSSGNKVDGVAMSWSAVTPLEGDPASPQSAQTDPLRATNQRDVLGTDTDDNAVDFNLMSAGCGSIG